MVITLENASTYLFYLSELTLRELDRFYNFTRVCIPPPTSCIPQRKISGRAFRTPASLMSGMSGAKLRRAHLEGGSSHIECTLWRSVNRR